MTKPATHLLARSASRSNATIRAILAVYLTFFKRFIKSPAEFNPLFRHLRHALDCRVGIYSPYIPRNVPTGAVGTRTTSAKTLRVVERGKQ